MSAIGNDSLKQIFTEARSFNSWQPTTVSDQTLHEIYDLMKWGPTSANCCPARIVFVKNGPQKEKLLSCLPPTNLEKVKAAPVTAIIAYDENFYDLLPKLMPPAPQYRDVFAKDQALAEATRFRNSSLQGAYFMIAARALGLDCGPMSGFDSKKLDAAFFAETSWKSNFICNVGYGDKSKLFPRLPRLAFDEACRIV
jgi:nitroreductase